MCFDSGNEAAPPLKGDVHLPHGTPRCALPSSSASSSPALLPQSQWGMGVFGLRLFVLSFFFFHEGRGRHLRGWKCQGQKLTSSSSLWSLEHNPSLPILSVC